MPIYTVRYRFRSLVPLSRGSEWTEWTHHLHLADDDAAEASLSGLIAAVNDAGITPRLMVVRTGVAHLCTIYRRSVENWRSFTKVAEGEFSLPTLQTFSADLSVSGVPVTVTAAEAHVWPVGRTAVTVTEYATNGRRRRVYVGPVAPLAAVGVATTPGPDLPGFYWFTNPFTFDRPYDPANDLPNIHRDDLASIARDHCHNLAGYTEGGYSVVVSPTVNAVAAVKRTVASLTVASLSTRSSRGGKTDPSEHAIVPV